MKTVILDTWNRDRMYYNPDKSDFFLENPLNIEGWECEEIDLINAERIAKEKKYLGTVRMIHVGYDL
jgi:hypothetical protein